MELDSRNRYVGFLKDYYYNEYYFVALFREI